MFSYLILLIVIVTIYCHVPISVVSATSSTAPSTRSPTPKVNSGKEGTIVSGYGSASTRKSIFDKRFPKKLSRLFGDTAPNTTSSLWIRQDEFGDLWIKMRPKSGDGPETIMMISGSFGSPWKIQDISSLTAPRLYKEEEWSQVDGLYGMYELQSGFLWCFVAKTVPIYSAPNWKTSKEEGSWFNIRKVADLELVHVPRYSLPTEDQQKEGFRQLGLLRKVLKQHSFYYCEQQDGAIVKDITRSIQDSIQPLAESHSGDNDGDDDIENSDDLSNQSNWWKRPKSLWPDSRFFWNQVPLEPLIDRLSKEDPRSIEFDCLSQLLKFSIPVTSAFVGIQRNITATPNDSNPEQSLPPYDQILISRRSRFRAGTRFTARGADENGAVANYAETEQMCFVLDKQGRTVNHVFSHVQTRGSIPIRWSSPTDLKTYRPKIRIGTDPLAQARAFRLHLLDQQSYYLKADKEDKEDYSIVFVNLIDKHSDQGRLGKAFDEVLRAVLDVHTETAPTEKEKKNAEDTTSTEDQYVEDDDHGDTDQSVAKPAVTALSAKHIWYDFHAEVKNGRWERLNILLDDLKGALDTHGYFSAKPSDKDTNKWDVKSVQKSVVRTNCMDCLDRTNVVQSIFGRYMLFQQLASSDSSETANFAKSFAWPFRMDRLTLPWSTGESAHRLLWADNADAISQLYAGTPALKRDFTRYGKRTKMGALDDGVNSAMRFYLNNFLDSDRQEGMDLMVGFSSFIDPYSDTIGDVASDSETGSDLVSEKTESNSFANLATAWWEDRTTGKDNEDDDEGGSTSDLDENYLDPSKALSLRWLPGDLQGHLRSQVATVQDEINNKTATHHSEFPIDTFCSSKALGAMDERSKSDQPWWAVDLTSDTEEEETHGIARNETTASPDSPLEGLRSIGPKNLTPGFLFGMLFVGTQAPAVVATAVVGILGLVFLPEILNQ